MFKMEYEADGTPKKNLEQEKILEEVQETPAFSAPVEEETPAEEEVLLETTEIPVEVKPIEPTPVEEPKIEENASRRNFKRLMEEKEKAERERDELLRYLTANTKNNPSTNLVSETNEPDDVLDPDALAEGKHITKVYKKIQRLESQLAQSQQQTAEMAIEAKLKAQYPDFDAVVNQENLEILRTEEPELAESLIYNPDLYKKAVAAYKSIKKLNITKEETPIRNIEKEQIAKNLQKPRSINSISPQKGESPLHIANAFANGLTDEVKEQLYKEMNDAIKKA